MKKHLKIFLSMLLLFQLTIAAKGSSTSNSSPLLCIPSDHSYTAEVEMLIEGKATGGLIIFYNNRYNSGILADSENILANLRSRQFVTESNVINNYVFLRLKNINNTVDMYYNNDGEKWTRIQNSIEVSSMHHNVLSGFMSLRIGLCAIGKGRVTFKKFIYKPII
jgi:xylan 1,4-beta-xylosidase